MENKPDPFQSLKKFTDARIGLGRTGNSVPVKQSLAFNLAHAHARDAVYSVLEIDQLANQLAAFKLPVINLGSKAKTRQEYLQRPDLGRQLNEKSAAALSNYATADVCIVIADGLSAEAINKHSINLLKILLTKLVAAKISVAPLTLVEQGRVAIADEIGHLLNAKLSLILIGERPGLSAADSIGAYLTFRPKPGLTDDARNCVSNIRPQGLDLPLAADKLFYLINESLTKQLSGVNLKDNSKLIGQ